MNNRNRNILIGIGIILMFILLISVALHKVIGTKEVKCAESDDRGNKIIKGKCVEMEYKTHWLTYVSGVFLFIVAITIIVHDLKNERRR